MAANDKLRDYLNSLPADERTMFMFNKAFPIGRTISATKSAPANCDRVWNGNLCTKEDGKIWFGDLNLTREKWHIQKLANDLNKTVYVLRERDARFSTAENPNFENAVMTFEPV